MQANRGRDRSECALRVPDLETPAERDRDRDTDKLLSDSGWLSVRIWEHDDPAVAAKRIARIVKRCRAQLAA